MYINLAFTYPKNNIRIGFGLLTIAFAIGNFWLQWSNRGTADAFDFLYFFIFILLGYLYASMGMGKNPLSFLGKSFLFIDDQHIKLKATLFGKEIITLWDDVNQVQIKANTIVLFLPNSNTLEIGTDKMTDEDLRLCKSTLINLCKTKEIKLA